MTKAESILLNLVECGLVAGICDEARSKYKCPFCGAMSTEEMCVNDHSAACIVADAWECLQEALNRVEEGSDDDKG